ncbi:MAG: Rne/Rng family ribonuclease [Deltaproteobacteria bacterium]|jgi:ribonuclease E|nr:Rne/Rng family ribonuclease [Deltaproteobacteria bacterium]MBT6435174.1 Rne/Rng family ribonuclease [Deltaproteobacteria bacterium]
MTRKMVVNAVDPEEVRIALLENARLIDFDIETRGSQTNTGNIYKARIVDVEPSLNAAFVDYGADKQGFLTANDVNPRAAGHGDDVELDKNASITELLKPGQEILVQVTKDEVGAKGAVLTTYLALAGRYVVAMPNTNRQGVSKKIEDEETRKRMREAADKLKIPDGMGVIIRTAGKDRTKLEISRDLKVLLRLWENIQKESKKTKAPSLIFKEQDVIIRSLRDYFSAEIDEVILDLDDAYDGAAEYMRMVMPKHRGALTRYVESRPIFHHYGIEAQLETIYQPKVGLPSGGSLVIEQTEALVAIDVNSGKRKAGGHEETATATNMEAAKEVARQLKLRDLGGIIVVDFIDMSNRKNQQKVEKAMKDALKEDRSKVKVSRISRNGTLELTRQRIRASVHASMFSRCEACAGTGHVLNPQSHAVQVMRKLSDRAARGDLKMARVELEPKAADHLRTERWNAVQALEKRYNVHIEIKLARNMAPGQAEFTFETNPDAKPIKLAAPNFGPAERRDSPEDDEPDEIDEMLMEEGQDGQDEENETKEGDRKPKRSRRRRGRGRGDERNAEGKPRKVVEAGDDDSEGGERSRGPKEHFDLPTYRFIAPEKLGYIKPGAASQEEEDEDEAGLDGRSRARRRRGRRGGQRRRGQPRLAAGHEEDAQTEASAEAAPVNGSEVSAPNGADQAVAEPDNQELAASTIAAIEDEKPKGFGWLKKWLGL